ncbi:hypothetical protein KSS87_003514 [Heliosperma pusillum]|nr:hypothetical protein KSS87_003514 [Heliosperma pusillum]
MKQLFYGNACGSNLQDANPEKSAPIFDPTIKLNTCLIWHAKHKLPAWNRNLALKGSRYTHFSR